MSESQKPVCIIYLHEKGFWQADIYLDGYEDGFPPDGHRTGSKGGDILSTINAVIESNPGIQFIRGVTGRCPDCCEEYFDNETACDCGADLDHE